MRIRTKKGTTQSNGADRSRLEATQESAIACSDLSLSYGSNRVLSDLHFQVAQGDHVAVMGPSGSGKTTLLHILAGIVEPDSGHVQVAGLDLARARQKAKVVHRQHKVSMVFQFGELLPELRVGENVALPLLLRGEKAGAGRVEALLSAVGLDKIGAWPAELSGGETQRVAVARALVTRPEVVLCDEPTGALDAVNSAQVVTLLREAASQSGATLVVSTHDRSVAEAVGEIHDLVDGKLVPRTP